MRGKFFAFSALLLLLVVFMFPATASAAEVEVPDSAYTTEGTTALTITGIDPSWLDDLQAGDTVSIKIPAQIGGKDVTAIKASAFWTGNAVYLAYPDLRITNIDLSAATNLTSIGSSAFYNQLTGTDTYAVDLYSELDVANFTLPDSINSLGTSAFQNQSGLKGDLVMPNSLTSITAASVFQGCSGFTSLDLNQVTSISQYYTFRQCTGLQTIDLGVIQFLCSSPGSGSTFAGCIALEGTLVIPETLRALGLTGGNVFENCGTASSGFILQFPATPHPQLTEIPSQTFIRANIIGDLVIPEGINTIGNSAFNSTKISSVTFPSTIKVINGAAFSGCTSLTNVNFPDTLSHSDGLLIYNQAFRNFSAKVLTIPNYVKGLGSETFMSTGNTLSTVYLHADTSIPFDTGGGGNSPFSGISASSVIIAKDAASYDIWRNRTFAFNNPSTTFKNQLTYELQVDFCDPTSDDPIASMSPLLKLYNKSLAFVKNDSTGEWAISGSFNLPAVPAAYSDATGWSFTVGGTVIGSPSLCVTEGPKLYPSESPSNEYIWFGQYQQTLIKGPIIGADDPPAGEEGVDYVTLVSEAALPENNSYRYYKIEPIMWRILHQDGDTYTLISQALLDGMRFHTNAASAFVPWADTTIRAWLNNTGAYGSADAGFYGQAFSTNEKLLIDNTELTHVGTTDKVHFMSYNSGVFDLSDFVDAADALPDVLINGYADARMKVVNFNASYYKAWWLIDDAYASYGSPNYRLIVKPDGSSTTYANGLYAGNSIGVRPMVTITLTSDHELTHLGTYADPYVIGLKGLTETIELGSNITKVYGDAPFTIAATITPNTSTSAVTFTSSDSNILSFTSNANSTTGNFTIAGTGTVTVTATLPNGEFDTCEVTVNKAVPAVDLIVSPTSTTSGQNVTFTATVTGVTGGIAPAGTVEFYAGTTLVGTAQTLVNGTATLTANSLAVSATPYSITAKYIPAAAAPYTEATSPARELTIRSNPPVPPEETGSPEQTPTPTPTPVPSITPSPRPSASPSASPSATPTATPTGVPGLSDTPEPTNTTPEPSDPPELTPPPATQTPPPAEPEPTPPPAIESFLEDTFGDVTLTIGNRPIPLVGRAGQGVWALLNLILMIVGVIISIFLAIHYLVKKKRQDSDEEESREQEQPSERKKLKDIWTLIGIILGIVSLIVFFLTENMRLPMVIIDKWTLLMCVLFVASLVFMLMTVIRREPKDENADNA